MKPRYTDAFWGKHPFDGDSILYKNKNKNNNNTDIRMKPGYTDAFWVSILLMVTVSFIRTRTRTNRHRSAGFVVAINSAN